jgi:hypothetical protein
VGCGDLEPLWLMAQSVPSASLVPCVQLVPVDWKIANVAVNNGRSVITLDRAGKAAMRVELTASCDLAGATEVASAEGRGGHGGAVLRRAGGCGLPEYPGARRRGRRACAPPAGAA